MKEYKTLKALLNNDIFKEKLNLVLVSKEEQITLSPDRDILEIFEIAVILFQASDGKYYKVQVRNDRSDIISWKNEKQFTLKETKSLDIREIGAWEGENRYGNTLEAYYDYYRPLGKGKHLAKFKQKNYRTIEIEGYAEIAMENDDVRLNPWINGTMTSTYAGHELKVKDLERMADERGLRRAYIRTFEL